MTPRRYLVIANQTLAEAGLAEAIRQRQEAGPSSFYVLVANTDHGDLAARLSRAAPIGPAAGDATADQPATEHAQHRLVSSCTTFAAWTPRSTATSVTRTRSRR
jgi:hypothetical protein